MWCSHAVMYIGTVSSRDREESPTSVKLPDTDQPVDHAAVAWVNKCSKRCHNFLFLSLSTSCSYHQPTQLEFWPPHTAESLQRQLSEHTGIPSGSIRACRFVLKRRAWDQVGVSSSFHILCVRCKQYTWAGWLFVVAAARRWECLPAQASCHFRTDAQADNALLATLRPNIYIAPTC
jgi:hypothetical protein